MSHSGEVDLRDIYRDIGSFIELTSEHLEATQWGGRPAYQHQVRSHITNLCQAGYLIKVSRGRYLITEKGCQRIGL